MPLLHQPTRTIESARDELKALLTSKIERKWLATHVDSHDDAGNRIEIHVKEGSPDHGWVIVDHSRKRVQAFRNGKLWAYIDLIAGGRLVRMRA